MPAGHVHRKLGGRDIHYRRPGLQGSRRQVRDQRSRQHQPTGIGTHDMWGVCPPSCPTAHPIQPRIGTTDQRETGNRDLFSGPGSRPSGPGFRSSAPGTGSGPAPVPEPDNPYLIPDCRDLRPENVSRHLPPEAATRHPKRCLSPLHFCTGAPLRFAPLHGWAVSIRPPNPPPSVTIFYLCLKNRPRAPCAPQTEMSV